MNHPYPTGMVLTDADREAWAAYEHQSSKAAEQYKSHPTSFHRIGGGARCACGAKAIASGPCGRCETTTKETP